MRALSTESTPPGDAQEAAEAPTLLDTLARAPAAAALVVGALDQLDDCKALRLAHPQLRDAVGEATTTLEVIAPGGAAAARPPTPRRWPRLEQLIMSGPDSAALEELELATWGRLHTLTLEYFSRGGLSAPSARALASALRRMPALRALKLWNVELSDAAAAELFRRAECAPRLRSLTVSEARLTWAAVRALAAAGWPLEELRLDEYTRLGAAGVAALAAAPTFAIRRLDLSNCGLDAAALLAVANAPWPLEELDLSWNDFSAAAAGPALAALSRHARLRELILDRCYLSAAGFKALVEAAWPALTTLYAGSADVKFDGPHALGAAAFSGFLALKELDLEAVALYEAGARLLDNVRWPRLQVLGLYNCMLGDAGLAALARGEWPALQRLVLVKNHLNRRPTLEDLRRWTPALVELD